MARRVFFHIGAPKTGTTYLQHVMRANRAAMRAQGVLYADGKFRSDRVWASETARGLSHPKRPDADGAWARILEQVRKWDGDAVISHEFFGACDQSQARAVISDLAPAQVHLVFTARDYVRQAPAVWQERLKYGRTVPFEEFTLDESNGTPVWSWRTQDVAAILARWSVDLAPDRVHVVTVPPPKTGGNLLWSRFASVVGVDPDSCDTEQALANTSLGVVEAELLRRFDERLPAKFQDTVKAATWVRDVLANQVLAAREGERFTLSAQRAAELTKASQEAAEAIAAAGYDVAGDLADLVPDAVPPGLLPEDVPDARLLEAALDTIGELLSLMETRAQQQKDARGQKKPQRPLRSSQLAKPAPGSEVEPMDARTTAKRAVLRVFPQAGKVRRKMQRGTERARLHGGPTAQAAGPGTQAAGVRELTDRVAELEAEMQEARRLNKRIAELTDVVAEVLLPAEQRDDRRIHDALDGYVKKL